MDSFDTSWNKKILAVSASYQRIHDNPGVARSFYENLFKIEPKIRDYFRETDFDHQEKLFLKGLQYLIEMLDKKNDFAHQQILRLSRTHSFYGLKIHPHHYFYWSEALIITVRSFDPSWVDSLESEWREVIHFPISFMMSQYFNRPEE